MSSVNKLFSDLTRDEQLKLFSKLTKIAMVKTLNKPDAEDLVQITFEKALKNQDSFSSSNNSSLDAWMITILKNSFIDLTRKKKEKLLGADVPEIEISGEQDLPFSKKLLSMCIGKLKQQDREIISMVKIGEPYSYIAEVLSTSIGNIKKRVCEARKDLAICLEN